MYEKDYGILVGHEYISGAKDSTTVWEVLLVGTFDETAQPMLAYRQYGCAPVHFTTVNEWIKLTQGRDNEMDWYRTFVHSDKCRNCFKITHAEDVGTGPNGYK